MPPHHHNHQNHPSSSSTTPISLPDMLHLKIQDQSHMLTLLEKELINARSSTTHAQKQLQDFRVEAAKTLAHSIHEGRIGAARVKEEGEVEAGRWKARVRDLELQLFKEKLKSKQLEDSQKKILSQFAASRQKDVDAIVHDIASLKASISKSLAHRLKTPDLPSSSLSK
ncbi:hypothetical protein HDU98_000372 [Podochytrium sp. JEL0797]|nr:hypothetical protein HDU98_000372 [Podochytrium sp. JEL0797]